MEALRLDTRTDRHACKNAFCECINKLNDMDCFYPECTYIDMFTRQITHPDYAQMVKIIKALGDQTLENCCELITTKASDVSSNKLANKVSKSIATWNLKFEVAPEVEEELQQLDIEQHTNENGLRRLPNNTHYNLSKQVKDSINKCNRKLSVKRKREESAKNPEGKSMKSSKSNNDIKSRAIEIFEDFVDKKIKVEDKVT